MTGSARTRLRRRHEVARHVEDVDQRLLVLEADVDVQAEDHVGARHDLQVLQDAPVYLANVDLLL